MRSIVESATTGNKIFPGNGKMTEEHKAGRFRSGGHAAVLLLRVILERKKAILDEQSTSNNAYTVHL